MILNLRVVSGLQERPTPTTFTEFQVVNLTSQEARMLAELVQRQQCSQAEKPLNEGFNATTRNESGTLVSLMSYYGRRAMMAMLTACHNWPEGYFVATGLETQNDLEAALPEQERTLPS